MATREEILEEIRESKGEILGLETEQRLAKSEALKIAIGAQITAKQETLTVEKQRLLHLEQQSKFHCTFPLSFPNLLDVILCPISFDISSSPIQVRQLRKVRGDGYSWNVNI